MSNNAGANKKIAKNTLFLYIRMLFNMGAMLYISRVVLRVLGVEDFGVYNIVMGVVILFSFYRKEEKLLLLKIHIHLPVN